MISTGTIHFISTGAIHSIFSKNLAGITFVEVFASIGKKYLIAKLAI